MNGSGCASDSKAPAKASDSKTSPTKLYRSQAQYLDLPTDDKVATYNTDSGEAERNEPLRLRRAAMEIWKIIVILSLIYPAIDSMSLSDMWKYTTRA